MYKKKGNNMTIKLYKQIQFSDGYVFYEQKTEDTPTQKKKKIVICLLIHGKIFKML